MRIVTFTYEAGIDELAHPDPTVIRRLVEVDITNTCGYGCKVYGDPRSNLRVLHHNSGYGCRIKKENIS